MNNFFFIISIFFCFLSCKTQETHAVNIYSTSSTVSGITVDLPKNPQQPNLIEIESARRETPPIIILKDSIKVEPSPILLSIENNSHQTKEENNLKENNPLIQNLDTSNFSWEIGIRATQILDVRALAEYKESHIYDAANMDINDPSFVKLIQTLDKNSPVAVYSRSGIRSLKAAKILQENGFSIIYNLKGGLVQWYKDGKELVK